MRHGDVGALSERSFRCPPCRADDCAGCLDLFRSFRYGLVACDCDCNDREAS